jgi:hypothetical protein
MNSIGMVHQGGFDPDIRIKRHATPRVIAFYRKAWVDFEEKSLRWPLNVFTHP